MNSRFRKKKSTTKDTLNIDGAVQAKPNKGKYGAKKVEYQGLNKQ